MSGSCCDEQEQISRIELDPSSKVVDQLMKENDGPAVGEIRPCCVCEETRRARDDCVLFRGEENIDCVQFIEAHNACLASYGFHL